MRAFAFWKKGILGAITGFSVTLPVPTRLQFTIGYSGTPDQMSIQIDQYFGGNYYYYAATGMLGINTSHIMDSSGNWPTSCRATLTIYKSGVALGSQATYF